MQIQLTPHSMYSMLTDPNNDICNQKSCQPVCYHVVEAFRELDLQMSKSHKYDEVIKKQDGIIISILCLPKGAVTEV